MSIYPNRLVILVSLLFLLAVPVKASPKIDFKKTVLPVLQNSCFACHNNTTGAPDNVSPSVLKKMNKVISDGTEDFSMSETFPFNNDEPLAKQIKHLEKEISKGFMPPDEQAKYHLGAPLSDKDRKTLLDWVAQEKASLK